MRQVLRRPAQSPAGAFLRPLLAMVTEGMMMDGLKNARYVGHTHTRTLTHTHTAVHLIHPAN